MHFQRGGVSDYYIYTAGDIARRYARVCVRSFCPRLSVCVYIACVYTAAKAQARQRIRKSRVAFLYVTTQAGERIDIPMAPPLLPPPPLPPLCVRRDRHIIIIIIITMLYRPTVVVFSPCGGHSRQRLWSPILPMIIHDMSPL